MKQVFSALMGLIFAITLGQASFAQDNYRIKSGDTISVEVLEDNQLNRTLLVLPDGSINFPFAGTVKVGGRTADQAQAAIRDGIASNFAAPPTVFVTVSGLRPVERATGAAAAAPPTIDIYFTGEVGGGGVKKVEPGTTFLQAMAQSGGFSKFAATKRVQLRRTDSQTGKVKTFIINYRALERGAQLENEIYMQDGDVILVPERRLFE